MACRLGQPLPWDETRRDPSQSQSVFIWGGESAVAEQHCSASQMLHRGGGNHGCVSNVPFRLKAFKCSFDGCVQGLPRGGPGMIMRKRVFKRQN